MSSPNAPPLSASFGALWSLQPDFPNERQCYETGACRPTVPIDSTEFIGNSQQHFPAGGKSVYHTGVGHPEQSVNPLHVVNGNGDDRTINPSSTNIWSKTVKQLRLSEALTLPETTSIYEARCQMAAQRAEALVLIDSNSLLSGILTNKDIATRVIAHEIDIVNTPVSKVMTKYPIYVLPDTLVVEILQNIEQFRQLPVIENDKIIGLVHPLSCLFDEMANTETTAENYDKVVEAAVQRVIRRGLIVKQLPPGYGTIVPETTTIYEACCVMAAKQVSAVVLTGSNGLFSGILTEKDIVSRVIPCGIDVRNTPVSKVMTNKPIFVSYDTLPMKVREKILQGERTQLLVRETDEDNGFVYLPLSLQGDLLPTKENTAEKHKFIDAPQHASIGPPEQSSKPLLGVNRNGDSDETNGPGLTSFVHVTNSPYPNVDPYNKSVAPPPQHTDVRRPEQTSEPLTGVNGNDEWDETHGPGLTPYVHMSNSPYPSNSSDNLVAPPQQDTDVSPPVQSNNPVPGMNSNAPWDGTDGPGFTPLMQVTNSPYPNDSCDNLVNPIHQHTDVHPPEKSSNPLPGVNGNVEWDGSDGPGFTPFVHVTNSPYPNIPSDNLIDPIYQHTDVHPLEKSSNPLPGVDRNVEWDGSDGPGFTPFVCVTDSPYPNNPSDNLVDLIHQHTDLHPPKESSNTLPGVNGNVEWDGNDGPGFSPFVHVTDSPYPKNPSDNLVDPIHQHTNVHPSEKSSNPLLGVNGNVECDGSDGPIFSPFVHMTNSPYPNNPLDNVVAPQQHTTLGSMEASSNPLVVVNANGDDQTNNGSSTNIWGSIKEKTVKELGLSKALIIPQTTTIYEACCQMAAHKADRLVVTDSNALLTGILTTKHIVKGVIARNIDLVNTSVRKVMSRYPSYVMSDTLVGDALKKMTGAAGVTQIPVIENGKVIGLFDIMEVSATANYDKPTKAAIQIPRSLKVKQMPPELSFTVPDTTTIYEASCRMTVEKVEVVVLTDSNALWKGLLTKKDIVARVIRSGIDLVNILASTVMKKCPMFVSCDALPIETMQEILRAKYLEMLVIENGEDNELLYLSLTLLDCSDWGLPSPTYSSDGDIDFECVLPSPRYSSDDHKLRLLIDSGDDEPETLDKL